MPSFRDGALQLLYEIGAGAFCDASICAPSCILLVHILSCGEVPAAVRAGRRPEHDDESLRALELGRV